jgi:hypothetical protein
VNTFSGCIRNLISNGYYVDMSQPLASANSDPGQCPCTLTNSCVTSTLPRAADVIVPWYTWLIIALVLLLLGTIIALGLLTCIRRRQQQKTLAGLYPDDTRDNIIDYKYAIEKFELSLNTVWEPRESPFGDGFSEIRSKRNRTFPPNMIGIAAKPKSTAGLSIMMSIGSC